MSEDKHTKSKLGMIATGVVSGLLLVLYLPVLIWSSPWSENGCYTTDDSYIYFHDGIITSDNHFQFHPCFISSIPYGKYDDTWSLDETHGNSYSIKITQNEIHFQSNDGKITQNASMKKTYNPFTICHSKWLEWTAE